MHAWDVEANIAMVQEEYAFTVVTESKPNLLDEWFDVDSCWWTSQEVVPESNQLKVTLESSTVSLNLDDEKIVVEAESTDDQDMTVTVIEEDEREIVLEEVHEEVVPSHVTACHDGTEKGKDQQTNKVDVGVRMRFVQRLVDPCEEVKFERELASSVGGKSVFNTMMVDHEVEKAKVVSHSKPDIVI